MRAFVGLGSNVGDRLGNLRRAVGELRRILGPGRVSSLYESPPALWTEQGFFWNAVFEGFYAGEPEELLSRLKEGERRLGREGRAPNSPRVIDLDLLLFGSVSHRSPSLELPHPRLADRAFVLLPLFELAPETVLPTGRLAGLLLRREWTGEPRIVAGPGWVRENFFLRQEEN